MAQTASGDTKIKAFGLAAHLTLESLFDHLLQAGIMSPNEVQIVPLSALQKCSMHESPNSPWQAEAAEARVILTQDRGVRILLPPPRSLSHQ